MFSMFPKTEKEDLLKVTEELGLVVPSNPKIDEIKNTVDCSTFDKFDCEMSPSWNRKIWVRNQAKISPIRKRIRNLKCEESTWSVDFDSFRRWSNAMRMQSGEFN